MCVTLFFFWKEGRKTASLTYVIHRLNRAVLWSTLGVNKRWLVHVELSSEVRALVKAIKSGEAVFVSLTRALKLTLFPLKYNWANGEWFRCLFLIILDLSVRQDKAMLYDIMKEDHRNSTFSSVPPFRLCCSDANRMPHFFKSHFEFDSFCVSHRAVWHGCRWNLAECLVRAQC